MSRILGMELNTLSAISPVDGRYASKTEILREYFSEFALIRYRLRVEVAWFRHLAAEPDISELPPPDDKTDQLLRSLTHDFNLQAAARVKAIEATTNHDVKAVEYYIRERMEQALGPSSSAEFVHFACTSEDINNLAYALMLGDARTKVLLPVQEKIESTLRQMVTAYSNTAMLSRTHGQAASPTTLGKEIANFCYRLGRQRSQFAAVHALGKMNGAVGNYNAHQVAYPELDWPDICGRFVASLGLEWNPYTTQIEPHDWMAEYFHALSRFNTILIGLCRDIWGYISLGYFRQNPVAGEVGSSTMPHKVNPIDFENAEGNLGFANAMLEHLASKLPVSRWQRDLTDSTVLRNLGLALAHSLIAYQSCLKGLGKLQADEGRLAADLEGRWEVLAEAIQTVMRRHGLKDSYEQLKALTRGKHIDQTAFHAFIRDLEIPEATKARLLALAPERYLGQASDLAKNF